MKVDIIIPVKQINHYVYESIPEILALDYDEYGIIILPDTLSGESFPKARIIATGAMGPAEKRDLALKYSDADILAFLDDDAYPRKDWLKKAVRHFENPEIAAVGGPAVTPRDDSFWQRVSGAVFLSRIGGGNPERYWPVGSIRNVDDWPSVNLLVRKDIFEKVGGFNSKYWPGEDTKLCLDIVKLGKKIIYDPDVFVWHHRREGIIRHLKQIGGYGLHRGFFAKKFPATSRKLKYFIPSFFSIYMLAGTSLFFSGSKAFKNLYLIGLGIYLLALALSFFQIQSKEKNLAVSFMSIVYAVLTHMWYGIRFLQGFIFTKDLKSTLSN